MSSPRRTSNIAPRRSSTTISLVLSEVREVRAASCLIHQRVMRGPDILADATITAAFLREGRPKRQPRAWVEAFERLQKEDIGGNY